MASLPYDEPHLIQQDFYIGMDYRIHLLQKVCRYLATIHLKLSKSPRTIPIALDTAGREGGCVLPSRY